MNPPGKNPDPQDTSAPTEKPSSVFPDLSVRSPHEDIEPVETRRPLKLTYVTFLCACFAWGGYYTQRYSGGYGPESYNENSYGGAIQSNVTAVVDPYVLGKRLFADTCAKCHQLDGLGVPGQYPPLAGSEWVNAEGPARMIRIVLDAATGPITVKGQHFNNTMTPWRDTLTDAQIAAVITYVRTQKEWGQSASPVTPEEVAAIRQKTKERPAIGPWTPAELLALPDTEPAR